jgi:hypothetical protein
VLAVSVPGTGQGPPWVADLAPVPLRCLTAVLVVVAGTTVRDAIRSDASGPYCRVDPGERGDQSGSELVAALLLSAYAYLRCHHNQSLVQVARSVVIKACDMGGVGDAVERATVAPGVGASSQTLGDVTGPWGEQNGSGPRLDGAACGC